MAPLSTESGGDSTVRGLMSLLGVLRLSLRAPPSG